MARNTLPHIGKADKKTSSGQDNVLMAGIDGQGIPEKVREFVKRHGIEIPAVHEPRLGPEYRVSGYPTVYVLDGGNRVVGANAGEAPREVYEGWIEEAL